MHLGRWSVYRVEISYKCIVWDPNEVIDIGKWSICGGGRLEVLLCTYSKYIQIYICVCVCVFVVALNIERKDT